ncbi:hypothetical protein PIB30_017640 [Stylosanthes scabra]|uniref:Uncharacterized protein n=1 Tax=Stylosanthes scabra TaxID=79078 RepID=A0ABU6W9K7_9FABA|nr:hypothetical protein [Stylosanthes scabra]
MMLGNSSVTSGSHSRSRPHGSFANSQDRARSRKVPHWCGCGKRPVLRWSGTEANPERPLFGCPNYNVWFSGVGIGGGLGTSWFKPPTVINYGGDSSQQRHPMCLHLADPAHQHCPLHIQQ